MKYLKRFNESAIDRIDISDIDELKDLFTDFVDEFGYQFKEMFDIPMFGRIANYIELVRRFNHYLVTYVEKDELAYSMLEDSTYGKYVFFAMKVTSSEWNGGLGPVVILCNDVYTRILSMGYNCDVRTVNNLSGETLDVIKSGTTGKLIIFRIGKDSILKNNNTL
jgi:hypothetical protein